MVNINLSQNTRLYILKKEKNPIESVPVVADYYDFTDYLLRIKIKKKINDLSFVELDLAGIDTTTLREYVRAGNFAFIVSGFNDGSIKNKLIGKFLLEQPVYNRDNTVNIKGIQSSGKNNSFKQLTRTTNSFKKNHENETLNNVLFSTDGVCVDTKGDNVLDNNIDSTISDKKITIDLDFSKRIDLVNKISDIAECEWNIEHGNNHSVNPFSEGDSLVMKEKIGDQTSSKHTFNLSGSNTNCYATRGAKTINQTTNYIIMKGTNMSGEPMETEMFDGGKNETYIDVKKIFSFYNSFDGWLIEDFMSGGATRLSDGSTFYVDKNISYITDSLAAGDTKTYEIDGKDFEVTIDIVTVSGETKIMVNGELSPTLTKGELFVLSDDTVLFINNVETSGTFRVLFSLLDHMPSNLIKFNIDSYIDNFRNSFVQVKINNEVINGLIYYNPSYDYRIIIPLDRGFQITDSLTSTIESHKKGSDVVLFRTAIPTFSNPNITFSQFLTLPLNNVTGWESAGTAYIGSEPVSYQGTDYVNNTIEIVRIYDDGGSVTFKSFSYSYAHSHGIRVLNSYMTGNVRATPDNPSPTSNIANNGLFSETFSEESVNTKDGLDKKCQLLLSNKSLIDDIVELEVDDVSNFIYNVNLGDAVSINGASVINLDDSGASATYRYVEFDFTWPPNTLIVYLNKIHKKNDFNTGDTLTNSYNRLVHKILNDNDRAIDFNVYQDPENAGDKKIYEFYNKELDGVVLKKSFTSLAEADNNKAVNVQTLKEAINTVSGQSLWETVGLTSIQPNSAKNLRPNGTASIGTDEDYWSSVYADSHYFHETYQIKYDSSTGYLNFECNGTCSDPIPGFISGGINSIPIKIYKGNLADPSFAIARVIFYDSFIVPMNADTGSGIEDVSYRAFTLPGSIYYNTTMQQLRIATLPSSEIIWRGVAMFNTDGTLNINEGNKYGKLTVTTTTSVPTSGSEGDIVFVREA
jgi:hypothetical protein